MPALHYSIKKHTVINTAMMTVRKMVLNLTPVAPFSTVEAVAPLLSTVDDEAGPPKPVTAAPLPVVLVPALAAALSNNCLTAKYAGFFL